VTFKSEVPKEARAALRRFESSTCGDILSYHAYVSMTMPGPSNDRNYKSAADHEAMLVHEAIYVCTALPYRISKDIACAICDARRGGNKMHRHVETP
jgi:hypothetical protein